MVLKSDRWEFRYALSQLFYLVRLCLDLFEYSFWLLDVLHVILPLFRSSEIGQVGEVEIEIQVKFRSQVLRLYIEFCSEKHNVVNLNLLFTVPN